MFHNHGTYGFTYSKNAAAIRFSFYASLLLPCTTLMPPTACAETLAEAIASAYEHNPQTSASRAATRAAKERVGQAKAQFGPNITAEAYYQYASRQLTYKGQSSPQRTSTSPTFSISLNQPLLTFGALTGNLRAEKSNYLATASNLRIAEQELMANVIITYASTLRDEKLIAIARENLQQLTEQSEQIYARYTARYATETDLQQTRNRLYSSQAQLDLAQGNLSSSRNAYRNLLGHLPEDLAPLSQLPPLPHSVEDAQAIGVQASPVLEAARFDLNIAEARLVQARGNARPSVNIRASLIQRPISIEADDTREMIAYAQVGASMPLYASGLISAQIREASQNVYAAQHQLEQAKRNVLENIATYWDRLSATRLALPTYIAAVKAAEAALNGARQQQLAGHITALDVLDTARDLLNSRQAEAEATAQLYMQHALLLAAMGQLRVETFSPHTPPYDPHAYTAQFHAGLPSAPLIQALDRPFASTHVRLPADHVSQKVELRTNDHTTSSNSEAP